MKVGILIDLGNSETRATIVHNGVNHEIDLSNRFVKLDSEYIIPTEYRNEKSTALKYDGICYGNGAIVDKEFSSKKMAPSSQQSKTEQVTTYLSILLVLHNAYKWLSEILKKPIDQIDAEFEMRLLLPPVEHDKRANQIKENVLKIKTLEVYSPAEYKLAVTIKDVVILPEGATAYIGSIYKDVNNTMQIIPQNEQFTEGDVLVIDIGAGTTDIVLIRDTELIIESKETFKLGGNAVEAECRRLLNKEYDYYPDAKAMDLVLKTGVLKKGNATIEVDKFINQAKETFSIELRNYLVEYLTRNSIEIRSVKGLLVVGGGALPTVRNDKIVAPSMAEVLINYIKEITDSISLVDLDGRNPRRLNMDGLKLFYKFTS